jgi:hypothetical protein
MTTTPSSDPAPHLNATRARSGLRGRHVLWVLLISLLLVVIALFGAWGLKSHDLAATQPGPAAENHTARSFDAPAPQPIAQPPAQAAQP